MARRKRRLLVNPFREVRAAAGKRNDAVGPFHRSLEGYERTPLTTLSGLAAQLGVGQVYLKDESHRFGLGAFKALGASWALHRLLETSEPPLVVSTASAGNHGRGLSWYARRMGIGAVVFMSDRASPSRVASVREEGAEVVLVAGSYDDAVTECASRSEREGWQVVSDVGYDGYDAIPRWVGEGYGTILEEVEMQLAEGGLAAPDLIVVQGGVGCLAAAVLGYANSLARCPGTVVVEPVEADCLLESASTPDGSIAPSRGNQVTAMAGLNCRLPSTTAWPVIRGGTDVFLSVSDDEVHQMVVRLATPVAGDPIVVSGASGAAGAAGLAALCVDPEFIAGREALGISKQTRVLLFNTEGPIDPDFLDGP